MHEIHTEIDIDTTPEMVWSILTDFAAYPEWNPFIRQVLGVPQVGAELSVRIQPSGGRAMSFRPTVLVAQPSRELKWLGKVLVGGMFDGEHCFRLDAIASGVRFTQSERFSGILVSMFRHGLDTDTKRGFVEMNVALKRRAEKPLDAAA